LGDAVKRKVIIVPQHSDSILCWVQNKMHSTAVGTFLLRNYNSPLRIASGVDIVGRKVLKIKCTVQQ